MTSLEIALDRRISAYDAAARDDGHVPTRWDVSTTNGQLAAYSHCERCGADAAVRVWDDREWQAGKMRLYKCEAAPN